MVRYTVSKPPSAVNPEWIFWSKNDFQRNLASDEASSVISVTHKKEISVVYMPTPVIDKDELACLIGNMFDESSSPAFFKIDGSSGALMTLIDVMEREGVEGRESFLVREYWRPNRLVSFKTFATPLLYMGRRERKIAPNSSKIDIAQDKLCQCIRIRVEVMKLMRPLTAEERSVVVGATTMGKGSPLEILASHEGDSVQRRSMQTLRPGIWLNDEVNYFLKNCLKNRDIKKCAKEQGRRRSHFFNSFFVQTMFDENSAKF